MATVGQVFRALKLHPNAPKMWRKPSNFCPDFAAEGLFDVREGKHEEFGAR